MRRCAHFYGSRGHAPLMLGCAVTATTARARASTLTTEIIIRVREAERWIETLVSVPRVLELLLLKSIRLIIAHLRDGSRISRRCPLPEFEGRRARRGGIPHLQMVPPLLITYFFTQSSLPGA